MGSWLRCVLKKSQLPHRKGAEAQKSDRMIARRGLKQGRVRARVGRARLTLALTLLAR
jgi:hypothetical protein